MGRRWLWPICKYCGLVKIAIILTITDLSVKNLVGNLMSTKLESFYHFLLLTGTRHTAGSRLTSLSMAFGRTSLSWWPWLRRQVSVADNKRDNAVKPEISLWYMGYTLIRTGHEVWQLRFANGDIRLLQKLDIGQLITWSKFAPVAKHRAMKAFRVTKIKFQAFSYLSSKWKSLVTIRLQLPSSLWESPMGSFNTKLCWVPQFWRWRENYEILHGFCALREGRIALYIRPQTHGFCKILI